MDWFERHCACLAAPDFIVHVGAGRCVELGVYADFGQSRVLLVEPQAELAGHLRRVTAAMPNVEVLQLAVAREAGEASLRLFNLTEYSGLQNPIGLWALFPGLAQTGSTSVDTSSLAELVGGFRIDSAEENWLVIDAPAAIPDLIDALHAGNLERQFSHVFIRMSTEPLFEGAESATGVLGRLADLCYEPVGVADAADPDFPRYHMRFNSAALEFMALREATVDSALPPEALKNLVDDCVAGEDVHECLDAALASGVYGASARTQICLLVASTFAAQNDLQSARHFLQKARDSLPIDDRALEASVVREFFKAGLPDEGMKLLVTRLLERRSGDLDLCEDMLSKVKAAFESIFRRTAVTREHGHQLLIDHLEKHHVDYLAGAGERRTTLVEIGTTREDIPGQGSTRKLGEFCMKRGIQFLTIDMDPHNIRQAIDLFAGMNSDFLAVNAKGEDFLRDSQEPIDFLFLDAYDFDHGQHSELRQQRYDTYLGARINDEECHRMHLECARQAVAKLAPNGLVCIDDAWLDNGAWMGKGTLAVPFLLEHGFELTALAARAVLLKNTGRSGETV